METGEEGGRMKDPDAAGSFHYSGTGVTPVETVSVIFFGTPGAKMYSSLLLIESITDRNNAG